MIVLKNFAEPLYPYLSQSIIEHTNIQTSNFIKENPDKWY